jgi:hypothetical protein
MNRSTAKGQCAEILQLLIDAHDWVPLPQIITVAAQYNARILELRRDGFRIENKTWRKDGQKHSAFRLLTGSALPTEVPESGPPLTSAYRQSALFDCTLAQEHRDDG